MVLRARNVALLAEVEASEGVEETPSASTDAVAIDANSLSIQPQANLIETNDATGSLDGLGSIVGGMNVQIGFDVYLKGSAAAGTAPEWGKLLRACGFKQTTNASALPASPEACANGGSTTLAVLGSTAVGTADAYNGFPLDLTGNVEGNTFIADYTASKQATLTDTMGGSIVNTTNYQIPAAVVYSPASASVPSLTMHIYMDGLKWRFAGARGTVTLTLTSGGVARMSFRFTAMYIDKDDAAVPAVTLDNTRPPVWRNGKAKIERVAAAIQELTIDVGNTLSTPDNPNALEGFDPAQIFNRKIVGSINPSATLVATRDLMADFRAGTKRQIHAQLGNTAGNRLAITIPQALPTNNNPSNRSGLAVENVPFEAIGQDSGFYLAVY